MPPPTDGTQRGAAIIGGGPAGLMAAEVLAGAGLKVTVYDHMASVGRKFLLAGRGGLNLTHSEPIADFLSRYRSGDGLGGPLVADAISAFDPEDLRAWCEGLGETSVVGSSGRVFPESFRATPLLRAWLARLQQLGVTIETRHRWVGWNDDPEHPLELEFTLADGVRTKVTADVVFMALGGASWPRVGSDGGWLDIFSGAGIDVRPFAPANCGARVEWTETMRDRFAGEPIKNVAVSHPASAAAGVRGDVIITDDGLEGGPVYALSASLRDGLSSGGTTSLMLDLQPDLSTAELAKRLTERRRPKDSASTWLRRGRFHQTHVALLREATGNRLPTDARSVAALAKAVPVTVTALMPLERAISSAGGVAFSEIDKHFMLRKRPGVFVAGEMLDWEAPTGGYLLQACFSTAVAAAQGALRHLGLGQAPES